MAAFLELLGPQLKGKGSLLDTEDVLRDKTVGLYFSAHWCPPCRGFTPYLTQRYTESLRAKGLEIVFISSDKDEDGFEEYYQEMPWLALPYSAKERKAELSQRFGVQGIPTLIILATDGAVITRDGRTQVMNDPTCSNFPWTTTEKPSSGSGTAAASPTARLTEQSNKTTLCVMALAPLVNGAQGLTECIISTRNLPTMNERTCYWLLAHGSSCLLNSAIGITAALKWRAAAGFKEKNATITNDMGPWLKITKTLSFGLTVCGIWFYGRTEDDSRFWIRRSLCASYLGPAVIGLVAAPVLAFSVTMSRR